MMNPEVKALWLAALRSGEYEQATGALAKVFMRVKSDAGNPMYPQHSDYEPTGQVAFCCKGVLSDLAVKNGVDMPVSDDSYVDTGDYINDRYRYTYYYCKRVYNGISGVMPGAVVRWAGLAPHVRCDEYNEETRRTDTKLGIDPEEIDDAGEYTIGYTLPDGITISSLDVANDEGQPFTAIADIIEQQF